MPKGYVADFAYVLLFTVLGTVFALLLLAVPRLLASRNPNPKKLSTYECGMVPIGEAWSQLNVRYYIFALLFLVFDVEVVFLYPWAMVFSKLGLAALVEMVIFIVVLTAGLIYAWKKGVLRWG